MADAVDLNVARRANISNIVKKLASGATLSAEDKRALEEFEQDNPAPRVRGDSVGIIDTQGLPPAKVLFVQLVAGGATQADAYRQAYKKPKSTAKNAAKCASRHMEDPRARKLLTDLRGRSSAKTILSLNDRLALLAANAQIPSRTAAARNAQARAIEVYSKISGDQAPDRVEVTGDAEKPLHVVGRTATKAEKIAALLARRKNQASIPAA